MTLPTIYAIPSFMKSGDGDPIVVNPTTADYLGQTYTDTSGTTGNWIATVFGWIPFGASANPYITTPTPYNLWAGIQIDPTTGFAYLTAIGPGGQGFVQSPSGDGGFNAADDAITVLTDAGIISLYAQQLVIALSVQQSTLYGSAVTLPLEIVEGVNDTFTFTPFEGSPEVFTVAPGTLTTNPELSEALNNAIGATSGENFQDHLNAGIQFNNFVPYAYMLSNTDDEISAGPTDCAADFGIIGSFTHVATGLNVTGLPTSDPHVAGSVWINLGILTVSSG